MSLVVDGGVLHWHLNLSLLMMQDRFLTQRRQKAHHLCSLLAPVPLTPSAKGETTPAQTLARHLSKSL
jgi:hypothetical protein